MVYGLVVHLLMRKQRSGPGSLLGPTIIEAEANGFLPEIHAASSRQFCFVVKAAFWLWHN